MKNKLYVLVGVPCAGKSTWVKKQPWAKDCAYISTDKHIVEYANSKGKTYNEVFDDYMPTAVDLMTEEVILARNLKKDIIWDQTSTTVKSRARKFRMLPTYYAIAVVFPTPEKDELYRRLKSRPGKNIPQRVMYQMIEHWQEPTLIEGFKEIWKI